MFTRPPSKSERPPSACRLDSAFRAPGLVSNWARGMADAKGLLDADAVAVRAVAGVAGWAPPVAAAAHVWLLVSWRLAFWSSTLWDKEERLLGFGEWEQEIE